MDTLSNQNELELAVLASMLLDDKLEWVELNKIDRELFAFEDNQNLFDKILKMRTENAPYNLILCKTTYAFNPYELSNMTAYISKINNSSHEWPYLYNALLDQYCKLRARDFQEGRITKEEYNEKTEKYAKLNKKSELFNTQKNMINYIDDVGNIIHDKLKRYDIGYSQLMNTIGDIFEGNLMVVGGRTSMGKTSLMLRFAYNLASKGEKILFYTSEMNRTQLMNRIMSFVHRIKVNRSYPKDKETELTDILRNMAEKINITIANTSQFSEKEILDKIKESKATVLVLDYIQRFNLTHAYETRAAEFSDIANKLKSLALNNKIIVIAGSQMNRSGDSKELSSLKESGGIEEACDIALLIARRKIKKVNEEENTVEFDATESDTLRPMTIHIAKNRNGQTGEVNFNFMREYCDFVEY